MFFEDGECVACEVKNCLACDPRVSTQCLICKSGFTQRNQNGNCELNLEEIILLPGEEQNNESKVNLFSALAMLIFALIN